MSPPEFIALAEETRLTLPLGQWLLQAACAQMAAWAAQPQTARWTVSVNVSALQFAQAEFVDGVRAALQKTGATPGLRKLELTGKHCDAFQGYCFGRPVAVGELPGFISQNGL